MGLDVYLLDADDEIVDCPIDVHWTYGNAHRVLVALGGRGLVDEDGESRYFVDFDPAFTLAACERWLAEDGREDDRRRALASLVRDVLPDDAAMMAYRVGCLREVAEWGVAVGARAVAMA